MSGLSRRAFLALAALMAPAARLRAIGWQPPASISRDEFLRLSRRLVGRTRLDEEAGAAYLNALAGVPANVPLLAQLARRTASDPPLAPAHVALASTIVECWYTGTYTLNSERRLATHTGALMWSALNMPAPGTCAGAFGAWARPPKA